MIVVSDASPLNYLVLVGHVDVLPSLFGEVIIPPGVLAELRNEGAPIEVREFVAAPPDWLRIRKPTAVDKTLRLDPGELEAIALAQELRADALLIDERKGRLAAQRRSIPAYGTLAVLEMAAQERLLDFQNALDKLCRTTFRIDECLLHEARVRARRMTEDTS